MIPKAQREAAQAGDPDRGRPGGPGRAEVWCWNPSSRPTSSRARTGSARTGAPRTRSPRSTTSATHWLPVGAGGRHRRRVSTRSTTRALMDRLRARIKDKRVLALVKAFLKAGVMTELRRSGGDTDRHPAGRDPLPAAGQHRPVGAGRALRPAVADQQMGTEYQRAKRRRHGLGELAARPLRRRLRRHGVR